MQIQTRVVSSLVKVFADEAPEIRAFEVAVPRGDTESFQVAVYLEADANVEVTIRLQSQLAKWITVREVRLSPSAYPCHGRRDANYLRTAPGMYPDRLEPLGHDGKLKLVAKQWRALWIDVEPGADTPAGTFRIELTADAANGERLFCVRQEATVLDFTLPPSDLYHTEWLHTDCLMDYYGVGLDERQADTFFEMVGHYLRAAARRDINMILTPLFTPPLDTAVGGERTTVQLVRVALDKGKYSFDFAWLTRWIRLCEACGIQYLEMSHLFSQWGAKYAPKVMATVDGEYRQLFGWDTDGTGEAYAAFLDAFLPELVAVLRDMGVAERCFFHVSDEPHGEHLAQYARARALLDRHLAGFQMIDALSDFDFYQRGVVTTPIVANNAIEPFLAAGVKDLWTYYCTSQCVDVSNRFFAMPSARNRILGVQMYKYGVKGFLQWGFNFYNAQFSLRRIDPYAVTDAGEAFPSGDAFLVYPGGDGKPVESIRMMVLAKAFSDVRALKLLESLTDGAYVMSLVEGALDAPITFSRYPHEDDYLLGLRASVNRAIAERLRG